ncbi:MAG: dihydroxy-acid dehydratase, partial [Tistlia sp.]|uniref:dihydroxy-acid dehydratase domain-containing protein n=1 Tax=Tistlia sp. TaxID=3057121 RepID=UPI0034A49FDE
GGAAIPAPHADRLRHAEASGRRAVALAGAGPRPREIMTAASFRNALRVLQAVGGSTNGLIHLAAVAGRCGLDIDLEAFDRLGRETPVLVDLKPSGQYYMQDLFAAGGLLPILRQLRHQLELDCPTVSGRTLGEEIEAGPPDWPQQVVRPFAAPLSPQGGLRVLRGNLAPGGALIKRSAASPALLRHRGRAVVFDSLADLDARIDSDELEVAAEDVLLLRNAGPLGAPGMPESGYIPIPRKLARQGVKDMVRISDARMSGTAFGTVVLHVAPEAAAGGPLGLVRDGDLIELDVEAGRLELLVAEEELARRRAEAPAASPPTAERGYLKLFLEEVTQADEGCDFRFLRPPGPRERTP